MNTPSFKASIFPYALDLYHRQYKKNFDKAADTEKFQNPAFR